MIKLDIGAGGPSAKEGFQSVDARMLDGVNYVTTAWNLFAFSNGTVDEIYSRHMIEHLTRREAELAFKEWSRVLKHKGRLEIICPNLTYHLWQLQPGVAKLPSKWNKNFTNGVHGMAGLYGWQKNSHDVHQWGWTLQSLVAHVQAAGFEIEVAREEEWNLHLIASRRSV